MKPREKKLMMAVGLVAFVLVNSIAYSKYKEAMDETKQRTSDLTTEEKVQSGLMGMRDEWSKKRDWLDSRQPIYDPEAEISPDIALQGVVMNASSKHEITVENRSYKPVEEFGDYVEVGTEIQVSGSLKSIIDWVYELQSQESFRALTSFEISPDRKEEETIRCKVELVQWYAVGGGATASN